MRMCTVGFFYDSPRLLFLERARRALSSLTDFVSAIRIDFSAAEGLGRISCQLFLNLFHSFGFFPAVCFGLVGHVVRSFFCFGFWCLCHPFILQPSKVKSVSSSCKRKVTGEVHGDCARHHFYSVFVCALGDMW